MQTISDKPAQSDRFFEECTPGYYNAEGKLGKGGFFSELYGPGPIVFYDLVRDWRTTGDMQGLHVE